MYIRPKNLFKAGDDYFLELAPPGHCKVTGYEYYALWQPVIKKYGIWLNSGQQFYLEKTPFTQIKSSSVTWEGFEMSTTRNICFGFMVIAAIIAAFNAGDTPHFLVYLIFASVFALAALGITILDAVKQTNDAAIIQLNDLQQKIRQIERLKDAALIGVTTNPKVVDPNRDYTNGLLHSLSILTNTAYVPLSAPKADSQNPSASSS